MLLMVAILQYCAIETGRENEIPFHFPFIFPTCFTQIPQNFCETVFPHFPLFPGCGGN